MRTALSAPGIMLVAQAALTLKLLVRPGRGTPCALGVLGAMMTAGYAAERAFPGSLRHPRLPFTAIAVGGESLAIALTALAFRTARRR